MDERAYWLAWSQVPGVGPVLLRRLQQRFQCLSVAWSADLQALQTVSGIGHQTLQAITAHRVKVDPLQVLAQHQQHNPQFWVPTDSDYPRLLLETADPPSVLYYQGQVQLLENQGVTPTVAIVGTRDPSDYAKRWTRKIAYALASKGFAIVSGMAEGIDTQAHLGCLEAQGRTIAILGTGVDVVYPQRNQKLYETLLERGLVLSEYPAGTQPNRVHFPRRNRIIAGLSRAVLVMEAPSKSGALITAYLANEYARDVYVLPGSLDNPRATGCLGLVHRGAQLILGIGQLLDLLGAMPALEQPQTPDADSQPSPVLSPELEQLFQAMRQLCHTSGQTSIPFDLIVQQMSQPAGNLSSGLMQLELMGLVTQLPGMRYTLS